MTAALVFGSAGQDGRILKTQLEARGVQVTGIDRGDVELGDRAAVDALLRRTRPDEIYYLAAHHHSSEQASDDDVPLLFRASLDVHVVGLVNVLETMARSTPAARLFYASSSHVFGAPATPTQNEATPRQPINVYGMTKSLGMDAIAFYRRTRGVHASSGILYNHESPYRTESFVTMRLARGAARAAAAKARGEELRVEVGSLSAVVDWGWAPDYTDAMQRILAVTDPDDYVVATGTPHSVAELADAAFAAVGLDWRAHVVERAGIVTKPGALLVGDATKLRERTGWAPTMAFDVMVGRLVRGGNEQ